MKGDAAEIRVISFDVEGTLASPDFSNAVWYEGIPALYARRHNLNFEEALAKVKGAYDEVGDRRKEWYDIRYWLERFQLGDYQPILEGCRSRAAFYPEVPEMLSSLAQKYTLIATSGSAREFLSYLLDGIENHFDRVFSSISDYGQLKTPQFYLAVCREMDVKPREVVHIGDSLRFDVMAAQEAGIRAFHIQRGQSPGSGTSLASLSDLKERLSRF
jgi:5'-nucleotidase